MAELLDTVSKQLSSSIEIKNGMAALLASSADSEQRALDACIAIAAERDDYKSKYKFKCEECEKEKQRADKAEKDVEYWKNLALKLQKQPKVIVKGNAKVKRLVTGEVHEHYAKDYSYQGQYHQRIGTGREALSLV